MSRRSAAAGVWRHGVDSCVGAESVRYGSPFRGNYNPTMRYVKLLGRGETLALCAGQLTSVMGDRLYAMAVLWLVLKMTGSTELMAVVVPGVTAPAAVVGLWGGGLIDHWDKFRGMVGIDVARAIMVALIPIDYLLGTLVPWHFLVVGVGLGSLEALFSPSLQASLPTVVEAEDLQAVIGLMDMTSRLAQILGPGSAGLLLAVVSEEHFFSLDAASFIVSAVTLAWVWIRLRRCGTAVSARAPRPRMRDWRGGFDAVRADRGLSIGIALRVACNAANTSFTLGAPLLVATRFDGGIAEYGLILTAYGAGSLVGNVLAGNAQFGQRVLGMFALSWGAMGVGLLVVALAPLFWIAFIATLWMGMFGSIQHVSMELTIAKRMPGDVLGKVYSFQRVAMAAATSFGLLAMGALLARARVESALSLAGAAEVIAAVLALLGLRASGLLVAPWSPEVQPITSTAITSADDVAGQ